MFDLIEMPGFPVPFPRIVRATVSSVVDLILEYDFTIMDVINGLKKQVVKDRFIIEYNTGYVAELMRDINQDGDEALTVDEYKDALVEDMLERNVDVLRRIIFEEIIQQCGPIPLHTVARMLGIGYETATTLLGRAKKKMRNDRMYDKLKSIQKFRLNMKKPTSGFFIFNTIFVEVVE
jgi:hypothetical protein